MQKNAKYLFIALTFCLFYNCQKEINELTLLPKNDQKATELRNDSLQSHVFDRGLSTIDTAIDNGQPTILGQLRVNPYTVNVMTQAWNNLYEPDIDGLPATYWYVQFSPTNFDELDSLLSSDLILYDYPLEYEVIQMGDYYPQPGKSLDDFPDLYAVVAPNFVAPMAYTLLESLVLPPYDSYLTAEAFRLTGNAYENGEEGGSPPQSPSSCTPTCPNYPDCLRDPAIGCGGTTTGGGTPPNNGGGHNAPCTPSHPEWPDCLLVVQDPGTTSGHYKETKTNACGCSVYSNDRKPGGCIKVDDVQLSAPGVTNTFLPVRRVQVIIKDTWFTQDKVETTDEGCWRVDREYKGRAWMWVKFSNSRARFRGISTNYKALWRWLTTVKDKVGKINGPRFNNIEVNYHRWTNQGGNGHRYWGAATTNNALHEMHDATAADGINEPVSRLDVYVAQAFTDLGYALMTKQMGSAATTIALGNGLSGNNFFLVPFTALLGGRLPMSIIIKRFLPDVMVGIFYTNSDELKCLCYHEFAHAAHYSLVGRGYWMELVSAEVQANGHGSVDSWNAGQIAMAESWAEFLAMTYTDRAYGRNNSSNFRTWMAELEATWNGYPNHVPIGLHHDLIDPALGEPRSSNQSASGSTRVIDSISGFRINQLFFSLDENTRDEFEYKSRLINNYLNSTGNTVNQLDALFNSY